MNKELAQQYLKTKHKILEYSKNIARCQQIINDFNSYLIKLSAQIDKHKSNIEDYSYWEARCDEALTATHAAKKLSSVDECRIERLQEELKEAEYEAENATREESRAYCAGPFNVGFHHYEVPDYDARREANAKAEKIKRELADFGDLLDVKKDTDRRLSIYGFMRNAKKRIEEFNSQKEEIQLTLRSKYIQVLETYALLETLQQEHENLNTIINGMYLQNNKLKHLDIPEAALPQIYESLLKKIIDYLDIEYILNLRTEDHKVGTESLIQQMIHNNYAEAIMPKLNYQLKVKDEMYWYSYFGLMKAKCGTKTIAKIKSDYIYSNEPDEPVIAIDKEFDEEGYAIIKIENDEEKCGWRYVAIDIMGNIHKMKGREDVVLISAEVKEILNILYNRTTINKIDKSYFKDRDFVKWLNYYLERKYLYDKGLLDEDKKYLTQENRQVISTIKHTTKQVSKQARLKAEETIKP